MDIKVYLDSLKGDDIKGQLNDPSIPFKTLDTIYTKIGFGSTPITFILDKGDQTLTLDHYVNCKFEGTGTLLINKEITLGNCTIDCPINVKVPCKATKIITSNNKLTLGNNCKISILEELHNRKKSYPDLIFIDNKGDLISHADVIVKVDRNFSFVNNDDIADCKLPNVESQGGILLNSTENAKWSVFQGDSNIKINFANDEGYLYSSKKYNSFILASFTKGLVITNSKINITLDQVPNEYLLNVINPNLNEGISVKNENIRNTDLLLLDTVELTSNKNLKLVNTSKFTSINLKTTGIMLPERTSSKIKKISDDYILDDFDENMFHVDPVKNVTIKIPSNLNIGTRELYFKRLEGPVGNNKVFIRVNNLYKSTEGLITLDRSHPNICIYKCEDVYYIK